MSELGQQVRRLREERDWSQAKLAVEAGMAVSAVSQIETGKRSPSATSLSKLATALEVEVRDLFPLGQAPLFQERPEQGGAEQRREYPYPWMSDAFARQIDHLEDLVVAEERRSPASSPTVLALSRVTFSRGLFHSCRLAAEGIAGTHAEAAVEVDGAERQTVMNRLHELTERARTICERDVRIYEKISVAEEVAREEEIRKLLELREPRELDSA